MYDPDHYEDLINSTLAERRPETVEEAAQVSLAWALLAHASAVRELGETLERVMALLERRR